MEEVSFVLGPVTSLLVWRAACFGEVDMPEREGRQPDLQRSCARVRSVRELPLVRALGDVPLDVIVGSSHQTHRCKSLNTIVLKGQLPPHSFYTADSGVYVCSPELCFLLLARSGSLLHLIEIGCELCGTYAISHKSTGSFRNVPALTTPARIGAYLQEVGRRHGVESAEKALEFVSDGSDSPRETSVFLMLTLPERMGGYQLQKPKLNARLDIKGKAQERVVRDHYIVDELYLDDEGKPLGVVEYDSAEHHFKKQTEDGREVGVDAVKIVSDDERREAIRAEGIDVVTVRREDTKIFDQFDEKAGRIAAFLGVKVMPSKGLMRPRRITLFERVFDSLRWSREHQVLQAMAGYARVIHHKKAR